MKTIASYLLMFFANIYQEHVNSGIKQLKLVVLNYLDYLK